MYRTFKEISYEKNSGNQYLWHYRGETVRLAVGKRGFDSYIKSH